MPVMLKEFYQLSEKDRADVAEIFAQAVARAYEESLRREAEERRSHGTGLDLFNELRGKGPFLDDEEMKIFNRPRDYGRNVELE